MLIENLKINNLEIIVANNLTQLNKGKVIKDAKLADLKAISGQEDKRATTLNRIKKYKQRLEPWRGTI